jgi:hypothetical protein
VNLYSRVYEREKLVALLRTLGRRSRRLLWGGAFVGLYDWTEEEGVDMRRHCREIDICNSLTQVWPFTVLSSVADPGCLSRILIFTHPGSRIPDPKTALKERGKKN